MDDRIASIAIRRAEAAGYYRGLAGGLALLSVLVAPLLIIWLFAHG